MKKVLRYEAPESWEGKILLQVLRGDIGLSYTLVKRMKQYPRGIVVNGEHVHVDIRVHAGDILELLAEPEAEEPGVEPAEGPLEIVYEDDDLIILNKPAGTAVHPSFGHLTDSLANYAAWHFAQRGESLIFRPVNRLDRSTSGLVAVAKSGYVQEILKKQREDGTLVRTYTALVHGVPDPPEGVIDLPIARVEGSCMLRQVDPAGQRAVTRYRVTAKGLGLSEVVLTLDTGRTHQIRVHMSHTGHPLCGDFLYGEEGSAGIGRAALHAGKLTLRQPVTGEILTWEVPMPEDMRILSQKIREADNETI